MLSTAPLLLLSAKCDLRLRRTAVHIHCHEGRGCIPQVLSELPAMHCAQGPKKFPIRVDFSENEHPLRKSNLRQAPVLRYPLERMRS